MNSMRSLAGGDDNAVASQPVHFWREGAEGREGTRE